MSEEVLEVKIDKSAWPAGPWKEEPDRVQWQHAGYACLMVRHDRLGHWCGYVGVDAAHPAYGKEYNDCDVEVHGGLTYAASCGDSICHVPEPGMPEDVWWLGFDCAHLSDLSPAIVVGEMAERRLLPDELAEKLRQINTRHLREDTYRDLPYVKRETECLAEQLRALAEKGGVAEK
jgi:hypothetical protein